MISFSTGNKRTEDNEIWTTVTERENDVWSVYTETLSADKYIVLVDLNGAAFPHIIQGQVPGRIDVTSIYYTLDLAANTSASILYGVICRIDDTDADIAYFASIPFLIGAQQEDRIVSLRAVPSQVKLDLVNCIPQHGITNVMEMNVAAVNTGVPLDSPAGVASVTPAVGDLILKYDHAAGSSTFSTFVFYHTQR